MSFDAIATIEHLQSALDRKLDLHQAEQQSSSHPTQEQQQQEHQEQKEQQKEKYPVAVVSLQDPVNAQSHVGKSIRVVARVQGSRAVGKKMLFFTLRQSTATIQALLFVDNVNITKTILAFGASITPESLVDILAIVVAVPAASLVTSCTVQNIELKITRLSVISAADRLPFSVVEASRSAAEIAASQVLNPDGSIQSGFCPVALATRLDNRVVDLRVPAHQAIFRIQAAVVRLFRSYLDARGFVEIHTPKLIGAASEGGADVFKVQYFDRNAYLAQSPQLYKQMMICADFDRVYEVGPVFRSENSFTKRHMTEFNGLDLEMAFTDHYHEVLDLLCDMFVFIFDGLEQQFGDLLATVRQQYPSTPFTYPRKTLRLAYTEGVSLLRAEGVVMSDTDDLSTENERLVKKTYGTDFFVLDSFPASVRPFYTMPDPTKPGFSHAYDFFVRGEEILSGAQRIHDAEMLRQSARAVGVDVEEPSFRAYVDAFRFGAPKHAGGGVGLERLVMLYLDLGDIRRASLFPRDPKRLEP